jgi:hypothetical protein
VIETGNPRVDLLRPELRAMYEIKSNEIKQNYGNFVLIVSNFGANNNYYSKETNEPLVEIRIQQMKYQGLIHTKEEEEFERKFFYNRLNVFNKLQQAIKYLSKEFPDLKFIIRPHPSENHDVWKETMKGFQNVLVIFEGELAPWILAAKAVIHNSCTSGLESALLNRKAIAYIPLNELEFEAELPNSVSEIAKTEVEIKNLIVKSPMYQQYPDILHDYISSLTETMASEKIAQAIAELYKLRQPLFGIVIRRITFIFMHLLIKIKNNFSRNNSNNPKMIFKNHYARTRYLSQKFSSITSAEALEYLELYKKLLKKFDYISINDDDGRVEIYDVRFE